MRTLVNLLIVLVMIFVGWKLIEYWGAVSKEKEAKEQPLEMARIDPHQLPGLPHQLEPPLQEAYKKGARGLKDWLEKCKPSAQVKDPRLAWIELDYVVLLSRENPLAAKRIFAEVKKRVPPESPVYPRIKELEKTL
jgi:hypothetical protein